MFAAGILSLLALASAESSIEPTWSGMTMSPKMAQTMALKEAAWAKEVAHPHRELQAAEGFAACVDGMAAQYPCNKIDLLGHLPTAELSLVNDTAASASDIWGWTSPEGKEIAIIGTKHGHTFVDVDSMTPLGFLQSTAKIGSKWHDVKVYKGHAYMVSEEADHGMQVFDMHTLKDLPPGLNNLTATTTFFGGDGASFGQSHNMVINEETGYGYVVGSRDTCSRGGLLIVNLAKPAEPEFVACFGMDGYTHDAECVIYQGPDKRFTGKELCFAYNEDTLTVVDVTDKQNLVQISRTGYPGSEYTHQGWLTGGHDFLLLNDELDQAPTGTKSLMWDLRDLTHPIHFGDHLHTTNAIAHNMYTEGDLAYCSNYAAGLQILNISTIGKLTENTIHEVARFDFFPEHDDHEFTGVWSSYIGFASGKVVSSSIPAGLYVLMPHPEIPKNGGAIPPPTSTPECAPGCPEDYLGDGYCTQACNVEACGYDNGDCEGSLCDAKCPQNLWNNDQCDEVCNTEACAYDNGHCKTACAPGCFGDMQNDGRCDTPCMDAMNTTCKAEAPDCTPHNIECRRPIYNAVLGECSSPNITQVETCACFKAQEEAALDCPNMRLHYCPAYNNYMANMGCPDVDFCAPDSHFSRWEHRVVYQEDMFHLKSVTKVDCLAHCLHTEGCVGVDFGLGGCYGKSASVKDLTKSTSAPSSNFYHFEKM